MVKEGAVYVFRLNIRGISAVFVLRIDIYKRDVPRQGHSSFFAKTSHTQDFYKSGGITRFPAVTDYVFAD